MGRAPCCEKMGLKKGPWTPEEDLVLVNYIQKFGHGNWRALPKHAGLLRCGKSCRLRWINYLRPDIKRGNFTAEEEETIIKLHEMLGNRWSAIAARLPGRTDNEIKNVWHTHLKKKLLKKNQATALKNNENTIKTGKKTERETKSIGLEESDGMNYSPQQCSSDESSLTMSDKIEFSDEFPEMDESFWSEVLSSDESRPVSDFSATVSNEMKFQIPLSPLNNAIEPVQFGCNSNMLDGMDFWYNLFTGAGESLEIPEIFR